MAMLVIWEAIIISYYYDVTVIPTWLLEYRLFNGSTSDDLLSAV